MNDEILSSALRGLYEETVRKTPVDHPDRTHQCPSIPRFTNAMLTGWSPDERRHVSDCSFCQKTMAFLWEHKPPNLWSVAQFVAGVFPDRAAMKLYLERNSKFGRLQDSVFVRKLADVARALKGLPASIGALGYEFASEDWFGLSSPARGAVQVRGANSAPLLERKLNGVREWADTVAIALAENDSAAAELSLRSTDQSLSIRIFRVGDDFEVHATSPSIENSGRRVIVELLPEEGEPIRIDLRMTEDTAADVARAEARVPAGNAPKGLAEYLLLAGWIQ